MFLIPVMIQAKPEDKSSSCNTWARLRELHKKSKQIWRLRMAGGELNYWTYLDYLRREYILENNNSTAVMYISIAHAHMRTSEALQYAHQTDGKQHEVYFFFFLGWFIKSEICFQSSFLFWGFLVSFASLSIGDCTMIKSHKGKK